MSTMGEELERLARLVEAGMLSREEFEEQKSQLMEQQRSSSLRSVVPEEQPREIGAYRLLGLIGEGGMGAVYRARHRAETQAERQGGDVALKVMHKRLAANEEFRKRFEREATLGMRLEHPGIVRVHDLVVDGGSLGIVLEFVAGRALSDLIGEETGPLHWSRAQPMFAQLAGAVAHAHDCGVIHRDIKPENVLVDQSGHLKILDFGIAREAGSQQTRTGAAMGTVGYMAPEQLQDASAVDNRADVYALGMTLYEMLAGRLPWETGTSDFTVMSDKVAGSLPPPTEFYPDIPAAVVDALMRSLATSPEDRFASVAEMLSALNQADGAAATAEPAEGVAAAQAAEGTDETPAAAPLEPAAPPPESSAAEPATASPSTPATPPTPPPPAASGPHGAGESRGGLAIGAMLVAVALLAGAWSMLRGDGDEDTAPAEVEVRASVQSDDPAAIREVVSRVYEGWNSLDWELYVSAWDPDAMHSDGRNTYGYQEFRRKRSRQFRGFQWVDVQWSCDNPRVRGDRADIYCTYTMEIMRGNGRRTMERDQREQYELRRDPRRGWLIYNNEDNL